MNTQLNAPILNFEFDVTLSDESPVDRMMKEIERRLAWTKGFCKHFSFKFNVHRPEDNKTEFRVRSILGTADVHSDDESEEATKLENRPVQSPVRCVPVVRSKSFCGKSSSKASLERIKTVDLHGMDKSTALEVTLNSMSEAISGNYTKLVIIHGKGLGRLKCSVHNLLKQLHFIKSYRLDTRNGGRTVVIF